MNANIGYRVLYFPLESCDSCTFSPWKLLLQTWHKSSNKGAWETDLAYGDILSPSGDDEEADSDSDSDGGD